MSRTVPVMMSKASADHNGYVTPIPKKVHKEGLALPMGESRHLLSSKETVAYFLGLLVLRFPGQLK